MIIGAFVAGVIAAIRSTDSGAAGIRAGFLAAVVGLFMSIVTTDMTAVWPLSRIVFFGFATGLVLCVAPIFGLVCGRVGGWMANTALSRWTPDANAS